MPHCLGPWRRQGPLRASVASMHLRLLTQMPVTLTKGFPLAVGAQLKQTVSAGGLTPPAEALSQ